jgi:hypothetical protein
MSKTASGFFGVTWADGTVGAPAFSDGVVIADYSRRRIIIEQAAELRRREFDASGMNFRAIAPDFESVEVSHVVAGSPADVVAFVQEIGSLLSTACEWMVLAWIAFVRDCGKMEPA